MSSSENLRDRVTLSPNGVGSVFLGDIQRYRHFTTPSSRASSLHSTPTSSPPNTASLSGIFALHYSHGGDHSSIPRRSSLDDITDIDMDPSEVTQPVTPANKQLDVPTATPAEDNKPGKIDPVLSLELRLRWLEALILGIKQDPSRERKGKGKDVAEYASFGNAQTIASDNLKHGETLMRLAQSVQHKLEKALEGNEGLKRFMDNYDQHAHLLTPTFALSGILPDPPTYDEMTPEEMTAFLTEMEPDIRAADRDMLEIDALEKKGVLESGKLPEQEQLHPRLQALLTAYEEDAKLAASLEARIAALVQRHGTYIDNLSELFVAWDDTISEAEDKLSRMEREKAEKMRLGLS